ncbi:MAG: NifB/NifX family molybdenum-iron cluster-binding protein [Phycisphaerae bacterium]|nr:NifB/NifX family molybdenum-iron cluster-binding protein [Phycisphaerae bacterium]
MRVALPTWNDRISPVLDVATRLLVLDVVDGSEADRREVLLQGADVHGRARQILESQVDVLVCGAASMPLLAMLSEGGIKVISHRCGVVDEIVAALLAGELTEDAFAMPGCCGRRQRRRCGRRGQRGRFMEQE